MKAFRAKFGNKGESQPSNGDVASGQSLPTEVPPPIHGMMPGRVHVNLEDEVRADPYEESKEVGYVESQKSVIAHVISQMKDSKDLSRITLPTFILERRSLLEMFADYMAHPQMFLDISDGSDPEERMTRFIRWFLTFFHAGNKDKIAKKPYNPIIYENFHCSFRVPGGAEGRGGGDEVVVTYTAEQISHHPPISAFRFNCPQRKMELMAGIFTKSRFKGLSIFVHMEGSVTLRLGEHNEDYVFTLPSAFGRSILTVPWVELGDKVTVSCPQTGYSATVVFHTKSISGKRLHQVSAEVFAPQTNATEPKKTILTAAGHWNATIEMTNTATGQKEVIDTSQLQIEPKYVRPISMQAPQESQRLWASVSDALKANNIDLATQEKSKLEEAQRQSEQVRLRLNEPYKPRYFAQKPNGYVFIGDEAAE